MRAEEGMDVGETLREARLRCAMSLEDVERLTKVRVDLLHAIETNQKELLPHAIYVRGFVRAYAHEVGLDPDDIARQYAEQHDPVADVMQPLVQQNDVRDDRWDVLNSWFVLVMLLTVGFGGYKVVRWHDWSRRTEPATAPS